MYNLKIEAIKIIEQLIENKYEACLIGNYPFAKYHNSMHSNEKLKIKQFSIATNATLDNLKELFTIKEVKETNYNKYALIEIILKSNLVYFRVYYSTTYTSVVNKKSIEINSISKIINELSLLLDTIQMDVNSTMINYTTKKLNAFESIENKHLQINGNLREKIAINPLIILELCHSYSNINYSINNSMFKIISNNSHYLKSESLKNITRYFNMILMSISPSKGLKIIKEYLTTFEYNDSEIFKFLIDIPDKYLEKLDNFNTSVDLISRWTYLLKLFNETEYIQIIDNFNLSFKNRIIWMIQHFDIIKEVDYKMAIYNSKESLKIITEAKWDIFLLFEMFNRLTIINALLYPEYMQQCKNIIESIYSRPFFEYQLLYDDNELAKIANVQKGDWLNITKEKLLIKIIMCDMHPSDEEYLTITKEAIECGLISTL